MAIKSTKALFKIKILNFKLNFKLKIKKIFFDLHWVFAALRIFDLRCGTQNILVVVCEI